MSEALHGSFWALSTGNSTTSGHRYSVNALMQFNFPDRQAKLPGLCKASLKAISLIRSFRRYRRFALKLLEQFANSGIELSIDTTVGFSDGPGNRNIDRTGIHLHIR